QSDSSTPETYLCLVEEAPGDATPEVVPTHADGVDPATGLGTELERPDLTEQVADRFGAGDGGQSDPQRAGSSPQVALYRVAPPLRLGAARMRRVDGRQRLPVLAPERAHLDAGFGLHDAIPDVHAAGRTDSINASLQGIPSASAH